MNLRATPITLVTCVVLLLGLLANAVSTSVSSSLVLVPHLVTDHGQIWRVVTYPLVPGSFLHFLIATVALLWAGRRLELRIGRWRYLMLCVLPSIAAALAYLCFPDPDAMKLPLASPNFISSGILLAALAFALARRHVDFMSWKTWIVGIFVVYYFLSVLMAPRDILTMNIIAFLVAGALVFRQVRDARAAQQIVAADGDA